MIDGSVFTKEQARIHVFKPPVGDTEPYDAMITALTKEVNGKLLAQTFSDISPRIWRMEVRANEEEFNSSESNDAFITQDLYIINLPDRNRLEVSYEIGFD